MRRLVLLRHGQSAWNKENRFTGWTDVDLSEEGRKEAKEAGRLMKEDGFLFNVAFTSVLKRAIRTLWIALDEMDQMWIPVIRNWRLNERHYGALQGLDKAETAKKHGDEQVQIWRRSYDVAPPPVSEDDERHPCNDRRYGDLAPDELPDTESLKDTLVRVKPYWEGSIIPQLQRGYDVLVAAHGNSLRALIKVIDNISDEDIVELNVPTGIPLIYELDGGMKPVGRAYLGDPKKVKAATKAAAAGGKARKGR